MAPRTPPSATALAAAAERLAVLADHPNVAFAVYSPAVAGLPPAQLLNYLAAFRPPFIRDAVLFIEPHHRRPPGVLKDYLGLVRADIYRTRGRKDAAFLRHNCAPRC